MATLLACESAALALLGCLTLIKLMLRRSWLNSKMNSRATVAAVFGLFLCSRFLSVEAGMASRLSLLNLTADQFFVAGVSSILIFLSVEALRQPTSV